MPRTSAKVAEGNEHEKRSKLLLTRFRKNAQRPSAKHPGFMGTGTGRQLSLHFRLDLEIHLALPLQGRDSTRRNTVLARPEVGPYALDLIRLADMILQVVHDPKFPKRKREAQINFLADSIGGSWRGYAAILTRHLRKGTARIKSAHRILCYEYYIECSCGYKGHSRNHACPKCEAQIHSWTDSLFDRDSILDLSAST